MADLIATCPHCGQQKTVSEFAVGMTDRCGRCGQRFDVDGDNIRDASAPAHAPEAPSVPGDSDPGARWNALELPGMEPPPEAPRQPATPWRATAPPKDPEPANRSGLHASSAADRETTGYCERCRRAFRGAWDQHASNMGTVCTICINLAPGSAPDVPERIQAEPAPVVDFSPPESEDAPPEELTWPQRIQRFTESRGFRIGLYVAAGLILAMCVILPFTPAAEPGPAPEAPTDAEVQSAAEGIEDAIGATAAGLVRLAIGFFAGLIPYFAAFYFTLSLGDKLPNERLVPNLIVVGVFTLCAAGLTTFLGILPFGTAIAFVLILWWLWDRWDLGGYYLFMFFIFFWLGTALSVGIEAILMGIFASLVV